MDWMPRAIISAINNSVIVVINNMGPITKDEPNVAKRIREVIGFAADLVTLAAPLYPFLIHLPKALGN
jgi:hypothetical protein